jgi:hypothetical protein
MVSSTVMRETPRDVYDRKICEIRTKAASEKFKFSELLRDVENLKTFVLQNNLPESCTKELDELEKTLDLDLRYMAWLIGPRMI